MAGHFPRAQGLTETVAEIVEIQGKEPAETGVERAVTTVVPLNQATLLTPPLIRLPWTLPCSIR